MAQVIMPQQKGSALDDVARALSIAGSVYGIYADSRRLDAARAEEKRKADEQAGRIGADQESQMFAQGFALAPEGKGSVKREVYGPDGKVTQRYYYSPEEVKATAAEQARIAQNAKDQIARSRELTKEAEDRAYKIRNDFENSPIVKKQVEAYYAGSNARELLNSDTPVGIEVAKTQMARLAGEVGAIVDADIQRYGGSQDVISRIERRLSTAATGENLTPQDKQDLNEIIDIFQKKAKDNVSTMARRMAKANAQYTKMNENDLYSNLNPDAWFLDAAGVDQAVASTANQPGLTDAERKRGVNKLINSANKIITKMPGISGEAQASGDDDKNFMKQYLGKP